MPSFDDAIFPLTLNNQSYHKLKFLDQVKQYLQQEKNFQRLFMTGNKKLPGYELIIKFFEKFADHCLMQKFTATFQEFFADPNRHEGEFLFACGKVLGYLENEIFSVTIINEIKFGVGIDDRKTNPQTDEEIIHTAAFFVLVQKMALLENSQSEINRKDATESIRKQAKHEKIYRHLILLYYNFCKTEQTISIVEFALQRTSESFIFSELKNYVTGQLGLDWLSNIKILLNDRDFIKTLKNQTESLYIISDFCGNLTPTQKIFLQKRYHEIIFIILLQKLYPDEISLKNCLCPDEAIRNQSQTSPKYALIILLKWFARECVNLEKNSNEIQTELFKQLQILSDCETEFKQLMDVLNLCKGLEATSLNNVFETNSELTSLITKKPNNCEAKFINFIKSIAIFLIEIKLKKSNSFIFSSVPAFFNGNGSKNGSRTRSKSLGLEIDQIRDMLDTKKIKVICFFLQLMVQQIALDKQGQNEAFNLEDKIDELKRLIINQCCLNYMPLLQQKSQQKSKGSINFTAELGDFKKLLGETLNLKNSVLVQDGTKPQPILVT